MKLPNLVQKKNCYVPTPAGWVCCCSIIGCFFVVFTMTIHPFLAKNNPPVKNEALIIEGWLPDYCLEAAVSLYFKHHYSSLFITGGPLEAGSYLKEYKTYAELGAATLKKLSIPDSVLIPVPAPYSHVDRTYASAVAFKQWIDSTHTPIRHFTLISQSTHTRRSALLFKRALGKQYKIGSIAINDREYKPLLWWKSSKGVRSIINESIAYLYALFFITIIK
jgi:uncharacterized SAM-binding protein YcdF (DUF218 family)